VVVDKKERVEGDTFLVEMSVASNPTSSIVSMTLFVVILSTVGDTKVTEALLVSRETVMALTVSREETARSTVPLQLPQVIPSTVRSAVAMFLFGKEM
jgi:hypothetical protein